MLHRLSRSGLCLAVLLMALTARAQRGGPAAFFRARITAGPYLQTMTQTSVVVRWSTAITMPSQVRFGVHPDELTQAASSPGRSGEHVVLLSGLIPNCRYYYAIGASNQFFQTDARQQFLTAPSTDSVQSARVWVLGDPGTGYPTQKAVRDTYYRDSGAAATDLVLSLGDNAYPYGTEFDYRYWFFDIYRDMFKQAPVWPTLGNHDARSADSKTETGPYYRLFTLPRLGQSGGAPSGTQAYYSFDYGPAHFICLNSEDVALTPGAMMLRWLERDLTTTGQRWAIAFWHQCPYTKGSHDSDSTKDADRRMTLMRESVLPVLERGNVDLVLCGHTHVYERSFLLRGHYGRADSLQSSMILDRGDGRLAGSGPYQRSHPGREHGTVYLNLGSSGHITRPSDLHGLNYPAMCISLNVAGSVVLDISGQRLHARFLDEHGATRDEFTIVR